MAMTVRRIRGGRLHIVNQPDANGFEVLPKRRLVLSKTAWFRRSDATTSS
jgi:hypothetical protein